MTGNGRSSLGPAITLLAPLIALGAWFMLRPVGPDRIDAVGLLPWGRAVFIIGVLAVLAGRALSGPGVRRRWRWAALLAIPLTLSAPLADIYDLARARAMHPSIEDPALVGALLESGALAPDGSGSVLHRAGGETVAAYHCEDGSSSSLRNGVMLRIRVAEGYPTVRAVCAAAREGMGSWSRGG